MESLNDFFQTFEKQIEVFHTHLVQEIVFELRKRVQGNINLKMTSIFMSSEVNKRLAFITDDNLIHIDKIVDYLLLAGKMDSNRGNTFLIYLNIYDWQKYSTKKKLVLI